MMENDDLKILNKNELKLWFLTNNKSGFKSDESWFKKNHFDLYEEIIKNSNNDTIPFVQKIILYLNDIQDIPKCPVCGKNCNFNGSIKKGYTSHCSILCSNGSTEVINKKKLKYRSADFIREKTEKTKETNIKKYGVNCVLNSEIIKNKIKETNIKKYGVLNPFQSEIIKNKIKETNIKKYGVEHLSKEPKHIEKIKEKTKNTFRIRFNENISKLLNLSINDVDSKEETIIISNYCEKHNIFEIDKNNFYSRFRNKANICTKCYPIGENSSINELELLDYINNKLNVFAKKIIINNFEIDVHIPNYNLGIEYDGLYWHSNIFLDKYYHSNKTNLCEKNNIQLLHIFEDEWLFKKEIIKSIIKSKLNIYQNKIFARKCQVKEINFKTSKEFLNNNHLQGYVNSKIRLGLFYSNELVSIMTFGKKRVTMGNKTTNDNEYEMLRFCNKLNTQIVGGASKLLNYFIKAYNPKSILTFADRRYSNGNLYKKLGFEFIKNTEPNYFYFKKNELARYHRFKFRKDVLIKKGHDPNKTEHQIMNELGYYRIYDCGHMKFEFKLQ